MTVREALARDVREGLTASPKRLPPRWLYDALGSALFEAIGQLPWYRITRAEHALLSRCAPAVARAAHGAVDVIELGVGDGRKLATLVSAFAAARRLGTVHLVDVSSRALESASRLIGTSGRVTVIAHEATFEDGLDQAVAASRPPRLVLFLGSNIGNFDRAEAAALMRHIAARAFPGDLLLLGADLVKPEADLLLAYDDPVGVTAAFNRNLLQRLNHELDAAFDLGTFSHEARWNAACSRVEMHLVSRIRQEVPIAGASLVVPFEAGESIWTESSYKYTPEEIDALGASAGLGAENRWIDPDARFALTLFRAGRA